MDMHTGSKSKTRRSVSKAFIDSSVIVEALKGNDDAVAILKRIAERDDIMLMINPIVFSESTYIFIKYASLSRSKLNKLARFFDLLNSFIMLDLDSSMVRVAQDYIQRMNMLPNDALILATCTLSSIDLLISLDGDFREPCRSTGIRLIDTVEGVKRL